MHNEDSDERLIDQEEMDEERKTEREQKIFRRYW